MESFTTIATVVTTLAIALGTFAYQNPFGYKKFHPVLVGIITSVSAAFLGAELELEWIWSVVNTPGNSYAELAKLVYLHRLSLPWTLIGAMLALAYSYVLLTAHTYRPKPEAVSDPVQNSTPPLDHGEVCSMASPLSRQ